MAEVGQTSEPDLIISLQPLQTQVNSSTHEDVLAVTEEQSFYTAVEDTGLVREKTISAFGSLVYLVNQIFGPGILAVPLVAVQAGFIPSLIVNLSVCVASCYCSTKLISAIEMIPGNADLEQRIEYTDAVDYFFGKRYAMVFRIFLHATLQSLNIASIVSTALAFDKLFATVGGATWSLDLYPNISFDRRDVNWIFHAYDRDIVVTLTAGYLLVLVACVPMGFYNIDDNIIVQVVSFILLVILMGIFVVQWAYDWIAPLPDDPLFPDWFGGSFNQLLSVYIMSYSYTMLIMPWANEVKPEVKKTKFVWISGISSFISYLVIGTLLAASFPNVTSDNILIEVLHRKFVLPMTLAAAYGFAAFVILPGIPVFCITTRYDLVSGGLCSNKWGIFWGNVAPWLVSWLFTSGRIFGDLITWTSLITGSVTNFVIPLVVYRAAVVRINQEASLPTGREGSSSGAPRSRWSLFTTPRGVYPVRSTRTTTIVLAFVVLIVLVGVIVSAF